jgi:signal transduction histidine kinase
VPERGPSTAFAAGRTPGGRSLRLALALVAVAGAGIAGIQLALYPDAEGHRWVLFAFSLVGFEFVVAGVLAWHRRPSNRTGFLLCVGGFSLLASACGNLPSSSLLAVGILTAELPIGVMLHLLVAFPSGRLRDKTGRALVAVGYGATVGLQIPQYISRSEPDVVKTFDDAQSIVGGLVVLAAAFVLARRLRTATAQQRRVLAALYGYGIFTLLFLVGSARVAELFDVGPWKLFELQILVVAGIPIAFTAGVLRGGFARTAELEELEAWLGAPAGRPHLRDALASALGDPTVAVKFWLPDEERYVDAVGAPTALASGAGRNSVDVELAGRRVAAIEYDAAIIPEPDIVRTAGRVVALALERERLTAELRAHQEALRESRARLVEAADRERRRIARDLHDGLQGRLVLLALQAATLGPPAADMRRELEAAIGELRELVHGVMPALLIERGLYVAAEELVDRMPIRTSLNLAGTGEDLPPPVETAGYFVVAEALANAVKHSHAERIGVRIEHPGGRLRIQVRDDGVGGARMEGARGLRGIADRVEGLGGRLTVDSRQGDGTRLVADIPCAS